ncbi:MAG: hypothetical protein ACYCWW_12250 [Deltaproteobacteria bacterium]
MDPKDPKYGKGDSEGDGNKTAGKSYNENAPEFARASDLSKDKKQATGEVELEPKPFKNSVETAQSTIPGKPIDEE